MKFRIEKKTEFCFFFTRISKKKMFRIFFVVSQNFKNLKAVTICVTRNRHENNIRDAVCVTVSVTQSRDGLRVDPAWNTCSFLCSLWLRPYEYSFNNMISPVFELHGFRLWPVFFRNVINQLPENTKTALYFFLKSNVTIKLLSLGNS